MPPSTAQYNPITPSSTQYISRNSQIFFTTSGGITVQTSYVEGQWHRNWAYRSQKLFFCRRTRKSVKNRNNYSLGRYSETKRYLGWVIKSKMIAIHMGTNAFLAMQFCFGRPKSFESDWMRSVSKNMRCHMSRFQNCVSVQLNCTLDPVPCPKRLGIHPGL